MLPIHSFNTFIAILFSLFYLVVIGRFDTYPGGRQLAVELIPGLYSLPLSFRFISPNT